LDFVAPVPGASTVAGLFRITLKIEDDTNLGGRGGRLIMSFRPYLDEFPHAANMSDSAAVVLLENFSHARFSFFDTQRVNNRQWSSTWQADERLPDLVRLKVDLGGGPDSESFDLMVALKATAVTRFSGP
jgi:hypothetical protein